MQWSAVAQRLAADPAKLSMLRVIEATGGELAGCNWLK